VQSEALAAVRAWTRLDAAFTEFNRRLTNRYGVTGAQLAMLRLIHEWSARGTVPLGARGTVSLGARGAVPLATLRDRLAMHPATIGQLLDRLAERRLVVLAPDPEDRRRRLVRLTPAGARLTDQAPLAGPVRLRHAEADPARLRRLAAALTDAVDLFGLTEYATET
jgi:DNA-binding MarR family transcriptional regulator